MNQPLTKHEIDEKLKLELPFLRARFGVERLALFGSFVKEQFSADSDVDILVQLVKPLGLDFVALAEHLEQVLGRKVDLTTFDTLNRNLQTPRYAHIARDIEQTLSYV